jgi:hypothetical protein
MNRNPIAANGCAARWWWAACLLLLLTPAVRAQRAIPEDAFGWAYLDGAALGGAKDAAAQHSVVDSLLGWCAPGRVIQDPTTEKLVSGLIGDALVEGVPISLCVFDVNEEPGTPGADVPGTLREVRFGAAISIKAGDKEGVFTGRLARALTGAQRVTLPGNGEASEYRKKDWPGWRAIDWVSRDGEVSVGIGDGALLRWLSLPREGSPQAPVRLHRECVAAARPGTEPVAEVFVNIDRLRHAFADRFDDDAGARLLGVMHLANARSFMLHVRAPAPGAAPGLLIDATWSVRSEPRTSIRRLAMTKTNELDAADGVKAALPVPWVAWAGGVLDAYGALLDQRDARIFSRDRHAWSVRRSPLLVRLMGAAPGAVVSLDRDGSGCAFGAFVFRFPISRGSKPEGVLRDFRALLDPFADRISNDASGQTWWLRNPAASPVRVVSWGFKSGGDGAGAHADELIVCVDLGMENDWSWNAVANVRRAGR